MFYIVETEKQLERLENLGWNGSFVEVVSTNDLYHPELTEIVAVYIRPFQEKLDPNTKRPAGIAPGYIIPVSHNEGLNVSLERVEKVLKNLGKLYVLDGKRWLYYFSLPVTDLSLLYSMSNFEKLEYTRGNSTYNWYYNRYGGENDINRIIPLVKLYENCESLFDQVFPKIRGLKKPAGFEFYNDLATKLYFLIERNGIRVDVHEFLDKFKPTNPDFSIREEKVLTIYNMNNVTSRPTNSFNAVNFLAIPKGTEFRRLFKPSNSKFVELDFDGYHVRLVSDLLGFHLNTTEKAHKQLARMYFGKDEISDEDYNKAKGMNFKAIYGTIPEGYENLPFFRALRTYIDEQWQKYLTEGFVADKISGRQFKEDRLQDMNPVKLMNYSVQCLETSRNVVILEKVLKYLKDKKTKLILMTYDSFLLDWDEKEGQEVIDTVKSLMESGKTVNIENNEKVIYPVHVKISKDLNF